MECICRAPDSDAVRPPFLGLAWGGVLGPGRGVVCRSGVAAASSGGGV